MAQIHDHTLKIYGQHFPSKATIYNWVNEFKREKKLVSNISSPSTQKTVSSAENFQKLEQLVILDRRFKLSQLAIELGIPKTPVFYMLTEDLGMRKVSAR